MLSQVVQFAPLYDVILQDADVDLRATFDSSEKYGLGGPVGAFEKVIFRVSVKSPSRVEQVETLLAHAETACHASQSLIAPVPVSVEWRVNGEAMR